MNKTMISILCVFLMMVAVAWVPMGTGVQPVIRNIITDIRQNIDPGTYAVFMDDFFEFPQATKWDSTSVVVDAGSLVSTVDSLGIPGCLKITLGANSKGPLNGMNLQTVEAPFKVIGSPGKPDSANIAIVYETKIMVNNATQSEIYAGLTIEDETLSTGQTYGLFFTKHDNSATMYGKEIKASVAAMDSGSCGTISNRTWYKLRIEWNGASAKFYVNDVLKTTRSTVLNQPVGVHLKPTVEITQGDSTASYAYIDYMYAKQRR